MLYINSLHECITGEARPLNLRSMPRARSVKLEDRGGDEGREQDEPERRAAAVGKSARDSTRGGVRHAEARFLEARFLTAGKQKAGAARGAACRLSGRAKFKPKSTRSQPLCPIALMPELRPDGPHRICPRPPRTPPPTRPPARESATLDGSQADLSGVGDDPAARARPAQGRTERPRNICGGRV
jgi:hypothetical protein